LRAGQVFSLFRPGTREVRVGSSGPSLFPFGLHSGPAVPSRVSHPALFPGGPSDKTGFCNDSVTKGQVLRVPRWPPS
jgi:hypothetical protein